MTGLSVLMPVRNGSKTLRSALRSTLQALPSDGELLVLDDGSTDGTEEVLLSFADCRMRTFRFESSQGVANGLNFLLENASGELVGRMDADDISLPWRFGRRRLQGLRDADVVFGSVINFGESLSSFKPMLPLPLTPPETAVALLLENCVAHSTMVCRTDTLRRFDGYRQVHAEDYDLWLRMIAEGVRISRTASPAILYRRHDGQVSGSSQWQDEALASPDWRSSFDAACMRVLGCTFTMPVPDARLQILTAVKNQNTANNVRSSKFEQWKIGRLAR